MHYGVLCYCAHHTITKSSYTHYIINFYYSRDFGENKQYGVLFMVTIYPLIESATPYCKMACQGLKRYNMAYSMYVCMHVHMYACTYVCMYICIVHYSTNHPQLKWSIRVTWVLSFVSYTCDFCGMGGCIATHMCTQF